MIRSELVKRLAIENPHVATGEIEKIVTIFFETMVKALADGGRIELRGFGSFSTRARAPREARDPRTGEKVSVGAKRALHFKMGKELRAHINR